MKVAPVANMTWLTLALLIADWDHSWDHETMAARPETPFWFLFKVLGMFSIKTAITGGHEDIHHILSYGGFLEPMATHGYPLNHPFRIQLQGYPRNLPITHNRRAAVQLEWIQPLAVGRTCGWWACLAQLSERRFQQRLPSCRGDVEGIKSLEPNVIEVCVYMCVYIYIYYCIFIYLCVDIYIYIHIYVYVYICIYIYIYYLYTYIYIYTLILYIYI